MYIYAPLIPPSCSSVVLVFSCFLFLNISINHCRVLTYIYHTHSFSLLDSNSLLFFSLSLVFSLSKKTNKKKNSTHKPSIMPSTNRSNNTQIEPIAQNGLPPFNPPGTPPPSYDSWFSFSSAEGEVETIAGNEIAAVSGAGAATAAAATAAAATAAAATAAAATATATITGEGAEAGAEAAAETAETSSSSSSSSTPLPPPSPPPYTSLFRSTSPLPTYRAFDPSFPPSRSSLRFLLHSYNGEPISRAPEQEKLYPESLLVRFLNDDSLLTPPTTAGARAAAAAARRARGMSKVRLILHIIVGIAMGVTIAAIMLLFAVAMGVIVWKLLGGDLLGDLLGGEGGFG